MNNRRLLAKTDPEIYEAIEAELNRQKTKLVLIASENYASPAVLAAGASVMTNKYAEGYPGHRYYGGCEFVDWAEDLAVRRGKELFNAEYVNVQPHAGSQANMAVYFSVLKPGDTILGMRLDHGGHLTHGSPVSFSGQLYNIVSYGVRKDTETIDYDQMAQLAREHRPKLILLGASAYPRTLEFDIVAQIAKDVDAVFMVDMAHIAGLVAAKVHPTPVGLADVITTTTHKTLRGPRGGMILADKEFGRKLSSGIFPGMQGGPLMHVIAAKAVALKEAQAPEFKEYQQRVIDNAARLAERLKQNGFRLVSGGTDNHLMLVDLSDTGLTGVAAEIALDRAGITANKNAIPFDQKPPRVTSGVRLGTPALTTRGLGPDEMDVVGQYITEVLQAPEDENNIETVRKKVQELCQQFPLYQDLDES